MVLTGMHETHYSVLLAHLGGRFFAAERIMQDLTPEGAPAITRAIERAGKKL